MNQLDVDKGEVLSSPRDNDWIYIFDNVKIHSLPYFYYEKLGIGHPYELTEQELKHIEEIKPYIRERANFYFQEKNNEPN